MKIQEILEGEYQSIAQIQQQKGSYTRVWVPRISALQARAQTVIDRVIKTGLYKGRIPRLEVGLFDGSFASANPFIGADWVSPRLRLDVTVFWDAPEETLTFVVAHELGHLHLGHDPTKDITPKQNRAEEMDADRFAAQVMKHFGYSQARVFRFMHSKQEKYQEQEQWNSKPDSSHPTYDQRIKQAAELGLRISQGGADQLDHFV